MADDCVSKGTILVVDHDPGSLFMIAKLCQSIGYMTITAQGAAEAERYCLECSDKIDVLLIDPNMKGLMEIDPITAIQKVKTDIPIIIVSEASFSLEARESLGVEGYIKKPFSLGDLNECLQSVISKGILQNHRIELDEDTQLSAKVMLVDDESDSCEVINEILYEYVPDATFSVKWAKSGQEAIELSKTFEPDIAIIDMKMPGMAGDELIKRLKSGEGYCPREFVIYTGVTEPELMSQAQNAGYHVLNKPADLDTLFEVLKRICLRHRLIQKK